MVIIGLEAMHGFFGRVFLMALQAQPLEEFDVRWPDAVLEEEEAQPEQVPLDPNLGREAAGQAAHPSVGDFDADKVARLREERRKSQAIATAFFQGSYYVDVYRLRSALEGERCLMAAFLRLSSLGKKVKDMAGETVGEPAQHKVPPILFGSCRGVEEHYLENLYASIGCLCAICSAALKGLSIQAVPAH